MIKFEDFDPNTSSKSAIYGVYRGGTTMKTFTERRHALSSFMHGYQAKLYQFVNGRWVEVAFRDCYHKAHGTCDICGGPTNRGVSPSTSWKTETGRWCWDKLGGKIIEPLTLYYACGECRHARGL